MNNNEVKPKNGYSTLSDAYQYILGVNWGLRAVEALDRAQEAVDSGNLEAAKIALNEYEYCRDKDCANE